MSVRVAECHSCSQLFVVYATGGEVVCPNCADALKVDSLEIVKLGVAVPIDQTTPSPAPPIAPLQKSETPPAVTSAEATPEPAEVATPVGETVGGDATSPSVADWLTRTEPKQLAPEPPEPSEPESSIGPTTAVAKPTLAESLGWRTDGSIDGVDSRGDSVESETEIAEGHSDFRFDFGATPLSDTTEAEGVSVDLSSDPPSAPIDQDGTYATAPLDVPATNSKKSRLLPVATAASILVAGPLVYFFGPWGSDSTENGIASLLQPASADESADQPAPLADSSAPPEAAEAPRVDPATQPASFDSPMPDSSFETASIPEDTAVAPPETVAPSDPFLATTQPPAQAPRDNTSVGDRYASLDRAEEPSAFVPPEDQFVEPAAQSPTPNEQASTNLEPVARRLDANTRALGLVSAPTYSTADLREALAAAEPAARGFSQGSLADPEQVAAMGQHYARLCYLAQVLTLLDPADTDPSKMSVELQAIDTLNRVFRQSRTRQESQQIAGPWVAWTGRPHGGVFFAGVPSDMAPAGQLVQYVFQLGDTSIPMVLEEPIDVDRFMTVDANEVGVFGVVVENPSEWIAGYEGDAERVIWARKTLALRRPNGK